ncbi:MAG: hypothetical protein A4E51_00063 [Methanosaeta sp. PtaU1.Bin055]|nr:MAG: hypothetical protein A4E51_00063 [Methanosaeta sp. PtaU1.Bin055]
MSSFKTCLYKLFGGCYRQAYSRTSPRPKRDIRSGLRFYHGRELFRHHLQDHHLGREPRPGRRGRRRRLPRRSGLIRGGGPEGAGPEASGAELHLYPAEGGGSSRDSERHLRWGYDGNSHLDARLEQGCEIERLRRPARPAEAGPCRLALPCTVRDSGPPGRGESFGEGDGRAGCRRGRREEAPRRRGDLCRRLRPGARGRPGRPFGWRGSMVPEGGGREEPRPLPRPVGC